MLKLILGDVGSGKTTACLDAVAKLADQGISSFLIVPEQETVMAETLSAETLPTEVARFFEVTNFTRLANTVFRETGGLSLHYATPADKALVMHKTLRELSPYLHKKPTRFDAGRILGQLDGMRALHLTAITTEDLDKAAKTTQNAHLKEKLEDLSLVYGFYRDALHEKYADTEDDLTELAKQLQKHHFFIGKHFFIDSFHSFTEQQYRVLSAILPYSEVTVTLTLPQEQENALKSQGNTPINLCFAEIEESYRRLHKLAEEAGVSVEYSHLGENKRQKNPVLRHIASHLWRPDYSKIPHTQSSDYKVRIVNAEDPFEGADFIAADILSRVQEGMKFGDFAIVAGDASAYGGILDVALTRAGIPNFLSLSTNVSVYEPVKMMSAAYAVVCGGFQRKDVLSYLKCGLCDIATEDIDAFELYTDTWHIDGKTLVQEKPWQMHPKGFGQEETPYSKSVLEGVERVKSALRQQLLPLMEVTKTPVSVEKHCRALLEFLLCAKVEEKLEQRKMQLVEADEIATAADYSRLWAFICDALDSLCQTLGEDVISADLFKELLKLTMEVSNIGRIPPSRDQVTIGSASTLRTENKKCFYLFGVAEEVFPGKAETSRLFSEAEAKELADMGLGFLPNMQIRLQKELFYFYRALSAPTEEATILCFAYDAGRNSCTPSDAVERVRSLGAKCVEVLSAGDIEHSFYFQHPNAAMMRLGTSLSTVDGQTLLSWYKSHPAYALKAEMAGRSVLCDTASLSNDTCASLWKGKMPLSQSKIDSFVRCPFSYHQKYVLELSDGEKADFGNKEIGVFIHDLLEHFLSDHDISKPLSQEDLRSLTQQAAKDYLDRITPAGYQHTAQMQHIFNRLCNTTVLILQSIAEEFAQSNFRPVLFELPIGFDGDPHLEALSFPLPGGNQATLRGYIDRVDSYVKDGNIYVRVLDYKTGNKTFSEDDLAVGINLQLLLYLNALLHADGKIKKLLGGTEQSEILPAGVLYLSCNPRSIASDVPLEQEEIFNAFNKSMKRSGLFLADRQILSAMEQDLAGKFIPVRQKSDGDLHKASLPYLKPLAEWEELFIELQNKVVGIAGQILSGKADAKPLQSGHTKGICSHCAYKPQCRNATVD